MKMHEMITKNIQCGKVVNNKFIFAGSPDRQRSLI